jgi:alkylhydroperoxidase/carboxymuconolactone decarboxylase family protein YurZ
MADAETPVLDLLAGMTQLSFEATTLDEKQIMLARLAALVASDAPPISYLLNLKLAGEVDVNGEEVTGMLAAIAPIVGTPRIATAAGNLVRAFALEELAELAALEADEPVEAA